MEVRGGSQVHVLEGLKPIDGAWEADQPLEDHTFGTCESNDCPIRSDIRSKFRFRMIGVVIVMYASIVATMKELTMLVTLRTNDDMTRV